MRSAMRYPRSTLQLHPVNVELPLPVSIPADYVADKNVRLGLYRRMADMRSLPSWMPCWRNSRIVLARRPRSVQNLLYQLKVKLLAERAGLASIAVEGKQIVLRYPEGADPGESARPGPTCAWGKWRCGWPYTNSAIGWSSLFEILQKLQAGSKRRKSGLQAVSPSTSCPPRRPIFQTHL